MDPEKHVINMSLTNKCLPLESLIKKMRNVICSLKVCILMSISKLNFQAKNCSTQL